MPPGRPFPDNPLKIMEKMLYTIFAALALAACSDPAMEKVEPVNGNGNGNVTPVTPVTPATPHWAALADSCTNVLVANFLDKNTGTFWSTPNDIERSTTYIYWQQAHALDVLLYAAERLKESDPSRSSLYLGYADKWFTNYANNYNRTYRGEGTYGGFFNDYTDDMAWICLTLIRITEVSGDTKYRDTAREVFDRYIWPRHTTTSKGTGLPWTNHDEDKANLNACTNGPSCLVAAKLYEAYKVADYLDIAKTLYAYNIANMPDEERVEEPPLTYTQGTFGEACRRLYHITGESAYMAKAGAVLKYAFTSNRCTDGATGALRHEGPNMDQSLFKAVLIPYAVNYVLDDKADSRTAQTIREKLQVNAKLLDRHLDRDRYPRMYCDYFWGATFTDGTPSMGAQTSGASLLEGLARLEKAE